MTIGTFDTLHHGRNQSLQQSTFWRHFPDSHTSYCSNQILNPAHSFSLPEFSPSVFTRTTEKQLSNQVPTTVYTMLVPLTEH